MIAGLLHETPIFCYAASKVQNECYCHLLMHTCSLEARALFLSFLIAFQLFTESFMSLGGCLFTTVVRLVVLQYLKANKHILY